MNTKTVLAPSKANKGFLLGAAGAGGAAVLTVLIRSIARLAGWYFGFSATFSFLLMVATAVLLFIAYMDKMPLFPAYIPVIVLGLTSLFGGSPLLGLCYTGGAVIAMLAAMGVLKIPALDGQLRPGTNGASLLAIGLFALAVVIRFINMIVSLFRYVSFLYAFFSFIAFVVFVAAVALSLFCTELKEVTVNTQTNYTAPQGGYAPQYQQSAPQYQQSAPAAPQGGQRAYDPQMFKMSLQVPGFCGLVKHILLLVFTCGIWSYIWVYRTTEFLNRTDREQQSAGLQVLLCILVPFYTVYWYYKNAQRIDRFAAANGVYSDLETPCLVCSLLVSGAAAIIMQEKLNCVLYTIYLNGGQMPQPQPVYQQPVYQQPVYQQPVAPQYQQPQYQAPAAPQAPNYQPPANQ